MKATSEELTIFVAVVESGSFKERVVVLKEGMLVMDAPKAQALNNSRIQQQQQQAATGREWKNENQSA